MLHREARFRRQTRVRDRAPVGSYRSLINAQTHPSEFVPELDFGVEG